MAQKSTFERIQVLASPNPYEPSSTSPEDGGNEKTTSWVRLAIYAHLCAIICCALLTLTDTRLSTLPELAYKILWLFAGPIVLSWMVFPALTIGAVMAEQGRSKAFRLSICVFSIALTLFQLWVCLPMVQ